jgi:uncharacterized protein YfaS (alpha-2-macroglobulin family)
MFNPGDTISRYFYFKDQNGNQFDPDTTTCTIVDPSGAVAATPTLARVTTGQYSLDWNIPSTALPGIWKIEVGATSGNYAEKQTFTFLVQPL